MTTFLKKTTLLYGTLPQFGYIEITGNLMCFIFTTYKCQMYGMTITDLSVANFGQLKLSRISCVVVGFLLDIFLTITTTF